MSEPDPPQAAGLNETLAAARLERLEGEASPLFNAAAVAAALVDQAGVVICASPAFAEMDGGSHIDEALLARALKGAPPATVAVELTAAGDAADTVIFAYALASQAAAWPLPPEVSEAAASRPDHVIVLTSRAAAASKPLAEACRAYGLTGLQTRVVLETIRAGNPKAAARALGISYNTAREALGEAMKRTRAARLAGLVTRLTTLAFGVLPDENGAEMLGDLWGLTPRQAAIAGLIANGISRPGAAAALGIGEAVVRKELERIHLILQVSSGAGLARKVVEANAMRWLTRATGGDIGFMDLSAEPLQFVHRADGSRIAFSDYGPVSGRPVLVVHSSMTSRIVARSLLRALQAEGFRPIAIDRPGFGMTDEVAGMEAGAHDPYATASADTCAVLDHLRLARVDLIARGAAQFVITLARAAPERLGRVVLTNPAPHTAKGDRNVGALGVIKEAFRRNPAMIRFAAAAIIKQSSYERLADFMRRSMAASPPDAIAVADPELVRDYFRAGRMFYTGRYGGYVNEQTEFAQGSEPPPLPGTRDWRVLIAAHDVLHDPKHVEVYWRRVLPDAAFSVIPDTGRFLALSHPQHVVAALAD